MKTARLIVAVGVAVAGLTPLAARGSHRRTEPGRDPHRRHGLRRHRAVWLEAQSHAQPRSDGGRRHEAHQLLRRAGLHAVAGADDDRLLRQAGLAAGCALPGCPIGISSKERTVAQLLKQQATPRCASASGTWAISRNSCPRDTASIIILACPTPTTWAEQRPEATRPKKPRR